MCWVLSDMPKQTPGATMARAARAVGEARRCSASKRCGPSVRGRQGRATRDSHSTAGPSGQVYVRCCGTKSTHTSFVTGLLQNIRYGMFEPSEVTGIPWYDRGTYGQILRIMDAGYLLPDTYEKWLRGATEIVARVYQKGDLPLRVRIEPGQFQA